MTFTGNSTKKTVQWRRNFWGVNFYSWWLNPALKCTVPKTRTFKICCTLIFPHR